MSEPNPLVERVDALLKRHQQSAPSGNLQPPRPEPEPEPAVQDSSVAELSPLESPLVAEDASAIGSGSEAPVPVDDDIPVLTDIVEPGETMTPSDSARQVLDEHALVRQIETSVLVRLGSDFDRVLGERLNRAVADLLDQAADRLRADLSSEVRRMVHEAVTTAVSKEVASRISQR